jgi:Fic family protein
LSEENQRHSQAAEAALVTNKKHRAELEALNGLKQYDSGIKVVQQALEVGHFKLRLSLVLSLHREALDGLSAYAGSFRPANVEISGSAHEPMGAHLVAEAIEEMCDYVNDNWENQTAIHLASYIMWRLNWIHPFADGNGRTSRILSFVVLSIKTGHELLGTPSIPEQIVENRNPYFSALDAADLAFKERGEIDVGEMEDLLSAMLAKQLTAIYREAGGTK